MVSCPHCKGHGYYESSKSVDKHGNQLACELCHGKGEITQEAQTEYRTRIDLEMKEYRRIHFK